MKEQCSKDGVRLCVCMCVCVCVCLCVRVRVCVVTRELGECGCGWLKRPRSRAGVHAYNERVCAVCVCAVCAVMTAVYVCVVYVLYGV